IQSAIDYGPLDLGELDGFRYRAKAFIFLLNYVSKFIPLNFNSLKNINSIYIAALCLSVSGIIFLLFKKNSFAALLTSTLFILATPNLLWSRAADYAVCSIALGYFALFLLFLYKEYPKKELLYYSLIIFMLAIASRIEFILFVPAYFIFFYRIADSSRDRHIAKTCLRLALPILFVSFLSYFYSIHLCGLHTISTHSYDYSLTDIFLAIKDLTHLNLMIDIKYLWDILPWTSLLLFLPFLYRKGHDPAKGYLILFAYYILWLFIPITFFEIERFDKGRFIIYMLPAIYIFTAYFFNLFKNKLLLIILFLLLLSFNIYSQTSYFYWTDDSSLAWNREIIFAKRFIPKIDLDQPGIFITEGHSVWAGYTGKKNIHIIDLDRIVALPDKLNSKNIYYTRSTLRYFRPVSRQNNISALAKLKYIYDFKTIYNDDINGAPVFLYKLNLKKQSEH
ncbi:hypothetical protein ACFL5G_04485, partial [Candidatus Margulisiibacteriota bacterium]